MDVRIRRNKDKVKKMKPKNPENEKILTALQSVGYSIGYARSILYGAREMKDLNNAKVMEKEPYFISNELWHHLYKKKQEKEK